VKATLIIGVLLVVFGIVSLTYQGITYSTDKKIIDVGPIKATTKEEKKLPPVFGGLALASGVVLILASRKSI